MTILFHAINGIGLGHLNRLVQIAKEMPDAKKYFITNNRHTAWLDDAGFEYTKTQYTLKDVLLKKITMEDYEDEIDKEIKEIIKEKGISTIVFDTHYPEKTVKENAAVRKILILRKPDNDALNMFIRSGKDKLFDRIIIPIQEEELEYCAGKETLRTLKENKRYSIISPIVRTDKTECKREENLILVMNGAGGQPEESEIFLRNVEIVLNKEDYQNYKKIVVTGPFYDGKIKINGAVIKKFDKEIISLMKKCTFLISPAGYNTVNEIICTKTPSLLVPLKKIKEKQDERARFLESKGAVILAANDVESINAGIIKILDKRDKIRINLKNIGFHAGNKSAAEIIRLLSKKNTLYLGGRCNCNCRWKSILDSTYKIEDEKRLCEEFCMKLAPDENPYEEIDKISKMTREITISGYEPLIQKGILNILKYCKNKSLKINITTNGRILAYEKICKDIKPYIDSVTIIIFSDIGWINDDISNVLGANKQIRQGIENIKKTGISYRIKNINDIIKNSQNLPNGKKVLVFRRFYLPYSEPFIYNEIKNLKRYNPVVVTTSILNHEIFPFRIFTLPEFYAANFDPVIKERFISYIKELASRCDTTHSQFGDDSYFIKEMLFKVISLRGKDASESLGNKDYIKMLKRSMLIVRSDYMKNKLIQKGIDKKKIIVIPSGIDLQKFTFQHKKVENTFRLLNVGHFIEKKRTIDCIKAVKILNDLGIRCVLDIYGSGKLKDNLLKEIGKDENIHIKDPIPHNLMPELYKKFDILLHPASESLSGDEEGIPNVLVEAMASGLPIITTAHAGIRELVYDTLFICKEKDPKDLADKIVYLINNNNNIEEKIKKNRQDIEKRFDIVDIVEKIEQVYDENN